MLLPVTSTHLLSWPSKGREHDLSTLGERGAAGRWTDGSSASGCRIKHSGVLMPKQLGLGPRLPPVRIRMSGPTAAAPWPPVDLHKQPSCCTATSPCFS